MKLSELSLAPLYILRSSVYFTYSSMRTPVIFVNQESRTELNRCNSHGIFDAKVSKRPAIIASKTHRSTEN